MTRSYHPRSIKHSLFVSARLANLARIPSIRAFLKMERIREPGQALVEFALVLPLLVFLLMGMFDLGRGIYSYNVVSSAAREGARYAIVKPSDTTGIRSKALAVTPSLDQSQLTMDAPICKSRSGTIASCIAGNLITVTVRYRFQPVTIFFAALNMVGKSTMTIE